MPYNPEHLKNLKPFTKANANEMRLKGLEVRNTNKSIREEFKLTATNFLKVKEDLPQLSPLDVIHMAMLKALGDGNYEDAARYAGLMAPYTNPKLQAITQQISTDIKDMSDEELKMLINDAGIQIGGSDDETPPEGQ